MMIRITSWYCFETVFVGYTTDYFSYHNGSDGVAYLKNGCVNVHAWHPVIQDGEWGSGCDDLYNSRDSTKDFDLNLDGDLFEITSPSCNDQHIFGTEDNPDARVKAVDMGVRVYSSADESETLYFFPYEPIDDADFNCSIYDDLGNFNQGC